MRQIIYDSESTGLNPNSGDRLVSVAAVEVDQLVPTGRFVHFYLNPGRPSSPGALAVHGLTEEFLADKPGFAEIAPRLMKILYSAQLVIHNASFDLRFLNAELSRIGGDFVESHRAVDTLEIAQRNYGRAKGRNTLDALTARFGGPDLRARTGKHGALVDCLQLVNVYRGLLDMPVLDFDLTPFLGTLNESEGSSERKDVPAVQETDAAAVTSNPGEGGAGAEQVVQ